MSTQRAKTQSRYGILKRLFDRGQWNLSPEAALSLLSLAFDEGDQERMAELAHQASANQLTYDDQREADFYEFLGLFLDLLHSKARLALQ